MSAEVNQGPQAMAIASNKVRPARVQGIDQIWIINLDRRRDRLERFMQAHPEMFGRINRLPAYDGKTLELTPEVARLFAPNNFDWHKPTMGCAMSHLALWQKLADDPDDNAAYLILEDDARLAPSWVATVEKAFLGGAVPDDWQVIFLGGILPKYREFFEGNIEPVSRAISRVKPDCKFGSNPAGYFHFCAYAYLLKKRGAQRLLELVESGGGIWMQADFLASYTTPDLKPSRPVYFFNPLPAHSFQDEEEGLARPYNDESPNRKVDSDIWKHTERFSCEEADSQLSGSGILDIRKAIGLLQSKTIGAASISLEPSGQEDGTVGTNPEPIPDRSLTKDENVRKQEGRLAVFRTPDMDSCVAPVGNRESAIALCADRQFFPYASVVILSLMDRGQCGDIPVFLFSEKFNEVDIEKFGALARSAHCQLNLVEIGEHSLAGMPSVRHMSGATYMRILVPELLKDFRKVLYLDSDLLVVSDLRSIFSYDLQGKALAAARDLVGEKTCKMDFFRSGDKAYFNAGVLLIDTKKWRSERISEKVIELAQNDELRERISCYADQCLINYIVRGCFAQLDKSFNWLTFEPRHCSPGLLELAPTPTMNDHDAVKILHFVGGRKPWQPHSSLDEMWELYSSAARTSPWSEFIMEAKKIPMSPASIQSSSISRVGRIGILPPCRWDYVSPNFIRIFPDEAFPQMIIGNVNGCGWPYLRREVPHNWYIDRRTSYIGFATRDEASILFNTALDLAGKKGLEIGCWMGWSAAHILMAGTNLDIIDPVFANPMNSESVRNSLAWCIKRSPSNTKVATHAGFSPAKLAEIAAAQGQKWDFAFIDGDHEGDGPLRDAEECERHLQENAIVLFHDLSSPFVTKGLDFFRDRGWNTRIYNTMQIMGVAWRGNISPVDHQPDPRVHWEIPEHLEGYDVSDCSFDAETAEFERIYRVIRPFTMVGRARLLSLYRHALRICRENIPGDFVECGACRGGSAALLAYVAKTHSRMSRKVYACDTFEGMPEPSDEDRHKGLTAAQCGFPAGSLPAPVETGLSEIARRANVLDTIIPVKGLFRDTLPALSAKIGPVALLHADGDWYESTMDIFSNLFEKVPHGGYVQIDDYGHWDGCRKAVQDYQTAKKIRFPLEQIDYTGFGFIKT